MTSLLKMSSDPHPRSSRLAGPSSRKVKFTKAEDQKLFMLVQEYSDNDWKVIAEHLQPRTPRQCRERWTNYVNPKLSQDPWTQEEDMMLIEKHREYGNHWKIIERYFVNRSKNNIKHRLATIKGLALPSSLSNQTPNISASPNSQIPKPVNSIAESHSTPSLVLPQSPSTSQNSPPQPIVKVASSNPAPVSATSAAAAAVTTALKQHININPATFSNSVSMGSMLKVLNGHQQRTNKKAIINPLAIVSPIIKPSLSAPLNVVMNNSSNSNTSYSALSNSLSQNFNMNAPNSLNSSTSLDPLFGESYSSLIIPDIMESVDSDPIIQEGSYDQFQYFDRILDQHDMYISEMEKMDVWNVPDENYF
ncbi:hypothetical protein TRFO_30236 [Tritrichomonas foetus]|uniref:Myb-like DNA-binding domain containing protein n=1 Tax=Tritrichomonas foetus TaxID=1144522 RepID=A0A1J4JZ98_9EUKA|nr:hypothetical protein TRFO_30236 [Tritrichomonas foetus]|eukprot:OHT02573.1 hypothetical protein TRFO_30236 [Tritrichomonas foetus]